MMNHFSDEQLMVQLVQGSRQAATVLYDRYQTRVYGYFVRMTNDREAARDLTQNTFLRVIRYAATWKDDKTFMYWLFRIARFGNGFRRPGFANYFVPENFFVG